MRLAGRDVTPQHQESLKEGYFLEKRRTNALLPIQLPQKNAARDRTKRNLTSERGGSTSFKGAWTFRTIVIG